MKASDPWIVENNAISRALQMEAEQAEEHAKLLQSFASIRRAQATDPCNEELDGWRDGLMAMIEDYRDKWDASPDFGGF